VIRNKHIIFPKQSFFLTVLFLFLFFNLSSQRLNVFFQNYQVEDGLPSNIVYAIETDTFGFLWIATDSGLCRYDGQHFRTFTKKEGLPDIEILDLFLDQKNRLWCNSFNGRVCYLDNGKVTQIELDNPPQNNSGNIWQGQLNSFWRAIAESADGTIRMSNGIQSISIASDSVKLHQLNKPRTLGPDGYVGLDTLNKLKKYNYSGDLLLDYGLEFQYQGASISGHFTFLWNEEELRCINNLDNNQTIISLKKNGINSSLLRVKYMDESFWIPTATDGLFQIKILGQDTIKYQYLKGQSITGLIKDNSGNFWISTFSNGIYKLNQSNSRLYNKLNGLKHDHITTFSTYQDQLFLGDAFTNLYRIYKDEINTYNLDQNSNGHDRIISIKKGYEDQLYIFSDRYLSTYNLNSGQIKKIRRDYTYKGALKYNQDTLISLHSRGINILDNRGLSILDTIDLSRPSCASTDGKRLWIGSANGLYFANKTDLLNLHFFEAIQRDRISDLNTLGENTCVCTANDGLYFMQNDTILHLSQKNGLVSDHCNSVIMENAKTIWYATNSGVNKISFSGSTINEIELLDVNSGLISNQVKKIEIHKNDLILATSNGLQIINNYQQRNLSNSIAYIDKIQVNNKSIPVQNGDTIYLKREENNLTFLYSAIDFFSSPLYEIQLEGFDPKSLLNKNRNQSYYNLPPGHFTFKLRAFNPSKEDLKTSKIHIRIEPHFWETGLFKLLFFSFMAISLLLLIYIYWSNRKKRLQLFQLKTEAELKALRAQINPHFMFNALNSIQDVILDGSTEKANYYISRFSKLMRMILEQSKTPYITLDEEVKMLELYLSLEQLRFDTQFTAEIIGDSHLSRYNTILPSAVLQPLVENAIWHGLLQKKSDAILKIEFSEVGEFIHCAIDDNGLGFVHAQKKNTIHNSSSLINLKERIALINLNLKEKITFSIDQSKMGTIEYPGTRIIIKIPKAINELI